MTDEKKETSTIKADPMQHKEFTAAVRGFCLPPDTPAAFGADRLRQPLAGAVFARSLRFGNNAAIISQGKILVNPTALSFLCPEPPSPSRGYGKLTEKGENVIDF